MELFLTLKLYLRLSELFKIELFWYLTFYTYTNMICLNLNCLTKLNNLR